MSDTLVSFLLTWLLLWAAMCLMYAALLSGLDCLTAWWQRCRRAKRQSQAHLAELARINQQAAVAVQRMYIGFAVAQTRIRDVVARREEVRR